MAPKYIYWRLNKFLNAPLTESPTNIMCKQVNNTGPTYKNQHFAEGCQTFWIAVETWFAIRLVRSHTTKLIQKATLLPNTAQFSRQPHCSGTTQLVHEHIRRNWLVCPTPTAKLEKCLAGHRECRCYKCCAVESSRRNKPLKQNLH